MCRLCTWTRRTLRGCWVWWPGRQRVSGYSPPSSTNQAASPRKTQTFLDDKHAVSTLRQIDRQTDGHTVYLSGPDQQVEVRKKQKYNLILTSTTWNPSMSRVKPPVPDCSAQLNTCRPGGSCMYVQSVCWGSSTLEKAVSFKTWCFPVLKQHNIIRIRRTTHSNVVAGRV